ncbi:uncharacterized protein [Salminus brasiliensis]|uniref:uncharacterized protein n=1 Tax=Salminus brasiliensis TaxID=930266 RepID=UPI003B82DDD6
MLCEFGLLGLLLWIPVKGLNNCKRERVSTTALTTELQSDVMLPCYFESALLRPEKAEDAAVVWSQVSTTVLNLLETNIHGNVRLWDSKGGRMKLLPKFRNYGNFSVILHKAQLSDQGLYRCELIQRINCSTAYQDLNLSVTSCRSQPLTSINITTELQSDVLLPCYFGPAVLGSDKTADIAAVWSQQTIPEDNLMEIRLQGEVMFWKNRDGRIEPFPKLSASGNFSIVLHKVQQSDLGLYRCELFKGISCGLAYQDFYISTFPEAHSSIQYWHYLLGAAVTVFLLSVCVFFMQRRRRHSEDPLYVNTYFYQKKDVEVRRPQCTSRGSHPKQEDSVYVNWVINKRER